MSEFYPYRPCVGIALFNREGKVFVGEQSRPVEMADLGPMLVAIGKENLEKRVYVRGDDAASFGQVATVLAMLQQAGFRNAGLVTDSKTRNPPAKGG